MERTGQWQQILCLVKDDMPPQLPCQHETIRVETLITGHVGFVVLRWRIDEMGRCDRRDRVFGIQTKPVHSAHVDDLT